MNNWDAYNEACSKAWGDYFIISGRARELYDETTLQAWHVCHEAVKQAREEYLTEEVKE